MSKRTLLFLLTLGALLVAPALAAAADPVVVPGVGAKRLTALDGSVVWISGQQLMLRSPDGAVAPVTGAPAASYRSVDLGHDATGKLVLTYLRCAGTRDCRGYSDDLAGHHATFKRLTPRRCELTAAPARWGSRVAYGLSCDRLSGRRRVHDRSRSGLFVRKNAGAAKRLRLPKDAVKFDIDHIGWVDLRATIVGAGVIDVYKYAFTQTVNGTHLREDLVAASEGDSNENVVGQALGSGDTLWTLVDAQNVDDPHVAVISRIVDGGCSESESLRTPPGPGEDDYLAEAMAVDGRTIYLYMPGTGIVTHEFTPARTCP